MTLMSEQGFGLSRAGLEQLRHHRTAQIKAAIKVCSVTLWSLAWGNQCTPWPLQGPFHMPLFKQKIHFLSSHNLKLNVFDSGSSHTNKNKHCAITAVSTPGLLQHTWMSSVQQLGLLLTGPQGRNLPALSPWDVQSHSGWKAAASLRNMREIQRSDLGFVSQIWRTLETILCLSYPSTTWRELSSTLWRYISLLPSGRPHSLYRKSIRAIQNLISDCTVCKQSQPWDSWIRIWKDSVPKSQIHRTASRTPGMITKIGLQIAIIFLDQQQLLAILEEVEQQRGWAMSACKSCVGTRTPLSVQSVCRNGRFDAQEQETPFNVLTDSGVHLSTSLRQKKSSAQIFSLYASHQ